MNITSFILEHPRVGSPEYMTLCLLAGIETVFLAWFTGWQDRVTGMTPIQWYAARLQAFLGRL